MRTLASISQCLSEDISNRSKYLIIINTHPSNLQWNAFLTILPRYVTLTELDLSGSGINEWRCIQLCSILQNYRVPLRRLRLEHNYLNPPSMDHLMMAISKTVTLRSLHLGRNFIQDHGVSRISVRLPRLPHLFELDLSYNKLTCASADVLARTLQYNSTLSILRLRGNMLEDIGAFYLARVLPYCALQNIDLSDNHIGNSGCIQIATALGYWPTPNITSIDLSLNAIEDAGCTALTQSLRKNGGRLKALILESNLISPDACLQLVLEATGDDCALQFLNLARNPLSHDDCVVIYENCEGHERCQVALAAFGSDMVYTQNTWPWNEPKVRSTYTRRQQPYLLSHRKQGPRYTNELQKLGIRDYDYSSGITPDGSPVYSLFPSPKSTALDFNEDYDDIPKPGKIKEVEPYGNGFNKYSEDQTESVQDGSYIVNPYPHKRETEWVPSPHEDLGPSNLDEGEDSTLSSLNEVRRVPFKVKTPTRVAPPPSPSPTTQELNFTPAAVVVPPLRPLSLVDHTSSPPHTPPAISYSAERPPGLTLVRSNSLPSMNPVLPTPSPRRRNSGTFVSSPSYHPTREVYSQLEVREPNEEEPKKMKVPRTKVVTNNLGETIFKGHKSYELMNQMQLGIHKGITEMQTRPHRQLNYPKDFQIKSVATFTSTEVGGTQLSGFRFIDYSPMVFRSIREFFGISEEEYLHWLCNSTWTEISTPGKSSALLYFAGSCFVIKTTNKGESRFLREMLQQYYEHCSSYPCSLLPHFFGHHAIVTPSSPRKIRFIIMNNVFQTSNLIHRKYDLKGSKIGRWATPAEKEKSSCIYKDNDINRHMFIGEDRKRLLLNQIRRDCDFLATNNVMDYSFLLGFHWPDQGGDNDKDQPRLTVPQRIRDLPEYCFTSDEGGMRNSGGGDEVPLRGEIYYFGIIDILQQYTIRKKLETVGRSVRHSKAGISAVPPEFYADRFYKFMASLMV